jgi:hypothetical protein
MTNARLESLKSEKASLVSYLRREGDTMSASEYEDTMARLYDLNTDLDPILYPSISELSDAIILNATQSTPLASGSKAWINDVFATLSAKGYSGTLDDFRSALLASHRHLLSRCDLVQAFDPRIVAANELVDATLSVRPQYHFVHTV